MMNDPRKWAPITHSGLIGHFYVQKISNCFVQKINTGFVQKINTGSIGYRSILHWFSLSVSLSVTQNQCLFQKVSTISALFLTYMSIHITFRKLENPRYQGQAGKNHCSYSPFTYKCHKSNIKNSLMKSSDIVFIILPAFYLVIWLMTSPKNFEKMSILKIWQLIFFWCVETNFGEK